MINTTKFIFMFLGTVLTFLIGYICNKVFNIEFPAFYILLGFLAAIEICRFTWN